MVECSIQYNESAVNRQLSEMDRLPCDTDLTSIHLASIRGRAKIGVEYNVDPARADIQAAR